MTAKLSERMRARLRRPEGGLAEDDIHLVHDVAELAASHKRLVEALQEIELLCCVCPVEYDETHTPEAAQFWESVADQVAEICENAIPIKADASPRGE